ncbi:unnamed protein product, partial [Discosporangium mesarthrocarpum]
MVVVSEGSNSGDVSGSDLSEDHEDDIFKDHKAGGKKRKRQTGGGSLGSGGRKKTNSHGGKATAIGRASTKGSGGRAGRTQKGRGGGGGKGSKGSKDVGVAAKSLEMKALTKRVGAAPTRQSKRAKPRVDYQDKMDDEYEADNSGGGHGGEEEMGGKLGSSEQKRPRGREKEGNQLDGRDGEEGGGCSGDEKG